jgi:hypothetical protein
MDPISFYNPSQTAGDIHTQTAKWESEQIVEEPV